VLAIADAIAAWPSLDYWEGASTSGHSVYARVVVPVHTGDAARPLAAAWAYAATRVPAGAVEMPRTGAT
jgi:hypothetical protein